MHAIEGAESLVTTVLNGHNASSCGTATEHAASAPSTESLLTVWRTSSASEVLQEHLQSLHSGQDEELYLQTLNNTLTRNYNSLIKNAPGRTGQHPTGQHPPGQHPTGQHHNGNDPAVVAAPSPGEAFIFDDLPMGDASSLTADEVLAPPSSAAVFNSAASLPEQWPRFLDNYVSRTHSWFPAIEKFTLYRSANVLNDSASTMGIDSTLSPGAIASLWASLALGSLCGTDSFEASQDTGLSSNLSLPLIQMAQQLASENTRDLEYGHVHAALVLAILELQRQNWNTAWIWTGRAIYVGAILNIFPGRDRPNTINASDGSKRLFRACFVLDTLVSSQVGHRSYMNDHDFQCVDDVSVDGMEEWETCQFAADERTREPIRPRPSKSLSAFNDLGRITALLNSSNQALTFGDGSRHSALLRDYLRMEVAIPVLSVDETRSQRSLSFLPPNLAQVKIAAAAVYLTLQARAKASNTDMTDITTCPSRGVSDTMALMQSPEFRSTTRTEYFTPPTAAIFLGLFERAKFETSVPFLPPARSRRRSAGIFGSSNPPPTERAAMPGNVRLDPNSSSEGGLSMSSNAPLGSDAAPAQPAAGVPQDFMAVSTNVPGDVDLFGQLTLLENADWYVPESPYIGLWHPKPPFSYAVL